MPKSVQRCSTNMSHSSKRVRVEQQLDALARGELALGVLGVDALLAAAEPRRRSRFSSSWRMISCMRALPEVDCSCRSRLGRSPARWPGERRVRARNSAIPRSIGPPEGQCGRDALRPSATKRLGVPSRGVSRPRRQSSAQRGSSSRPQGVSVPAATAATVPGSRPRFRVAPESARAARRSLPHPVERLAAALGRERAARRHRVAEALALRSRSRRSPSAFSALTARRPGPSSSATMAAASRARSAICVRASSARLRVDVAPCSRRRRRRARRSRCLIACRSSPAFGSCDEHEAVGHAARPRSPTVRRRPSRR